MPDEVIAHIFSRLAAGYSHDEAAPMNETTPSHLIAIAARSLEGIIATLASNGWPIFPPLEVMFHPFRAKLNEDCVTLRDIQLVVAAHVVEFGEAKASLLARASALHHLPAPVSR